MKSHWDEQAACDAVKQWGMTYGEDFARRLYSARLIGQESRLVLHGGGNVSVKGLFRTLWGDEREVVYVKASGWDLSTLDPSGMPGLFLADLRRLQKLDALDDEEMVGQLRVHRIDADAPTPSIEALLHVFLPHRFVDHSHADAVLALTNQIDDEKWIRRALGTSVAVVPYVRPGFDLARAVTKAYQVDPKTEGIVLLQHGLVTFGENARTSYEKHVAIVDRCERFLEQQSKGVTFTLGFSADEAPAVLASRVAPVLRGLLAQPTGDEDQPYCRSILAWSDAAESLAFVNRKEVKELAETGAVIGDHVIRTKAYPLFVENPDWSDPAILRQQLQAAIEGYRLRYETHLAAQGSAVGLVRTDPRVVLLPGAGVFCWGETRRKARLAAEITEHTLAIKSAAQAIGTYQSLSAEHLCDMETRPLQRAKLAPAGSEPLAGQVVVISGGAGAIGSAVAHVCLLAGAHVAVADLDESKTSSVVRRLQKRFDEDRILSVAMDVTDETSVYAGFSDVVRFFGGVDVLVCNAGVAHVAPIEELAVRDFQRVMEVNAVGTLLFLQAGGRIMKRQGLGGNIVVNASKNVFAPGKDFGAYSASKAACHQLGKVSAIELAPLGIRVNMINADAIFGEGENLSGLWAAVGPDRAKSRNLPTEELPSYYQNRNLLKARIRGRHVGNAVVFFASNATPTTGATLPIDGGVVEAFPR